MASTARERFTAWIARDEPAACLSRFRCAFALIWLCYDLCDLLWSGTAFCADWLGTLQHGAPHGLVALQLGLVACELGLLLGRAIVPCALGAVSLRAVEAFGYFGLNDFFYFVATCSYLVFCAPEPAAEPGGAPRVPAWVRAALVFQTGWIYVATATLKLNPAFLSGGHFLVRHAYLAQAHWPYPSALLPLLRSLPFNRALSWLAVGGEMTLGLLLLLRRGRPLAIALALGIHGFAALAVNVWFFGASMIAQVVLLFPQRAQPR